MELNEQIKIIWYILGALVCSAIIGLLIALINKQVIKAKNKIGKSLCKNGHHSWVPVFIKGQIKGTKIKIIACYCDRCHKGRSEMYDFGDSLTEQNCATYSEKYFNK